MQRAAAFLQDSIGLVRKPGIVPNSVLMGISAAKQQKRCELFVVTFEEGNQQNKAPRRSFSPAADCRK
jgi:hypothetical protein